MKKSLLTLAVASGLAFAGAAQAETTVYGHAQVEIGSHGGDSDVGMSVQDAARGRIGVKSTEDLGDGLTALVVAEFKTDFADGDSGGGNCAVTVTDTNGDTPATVADDTITCSGSTGVSLQKREMMVGLKGGFGQVELGRLKQAYKYFGGVKYDPFVATLLEARGTAGMSGKVGKGNAYGHNSFISDSFGYQNKFGGAAVRLTYDLDTGGPKSDTGANGMTFGVKYGQKKTFEVGFAIANDGEAGTAEYSASKIFGMYNMGGAGKIKLQSEASEKGTTEWTNLYLDYNVKVGKSGVVDVAFGSGDETSGGVSVGSSMTRLAYIHNLSKKTRLTVGIRSTDTDAPNTANSVTAIGIRKKF